MGAKLPDINTLIQAGIDPRTGLPYKIDVDENCMIKSNIRKLLRILDEQNAINRYTWGNLPNGLDGQLLERILYYKGQGIFFYEKNTEKFYFLPYALCGNIDVYGRFLKTTPVPFNGTTMQDEEDKDGKKEKIKPWIQGLEFTPVYDVVIDELTAETITESCVILRDYSCQQSQTNIARSILQDPLLDVMSECIPYMRTHLISSSGIMGMRVNSEDEQSNVKLAAQNVRKAALSGQPWVPVVGNVDFQDLTKKSAMASEDFLIAMQAMDNFRLSLYGLKTGGLFQKKSHMLEAEQDMNSGNVGLIYQDGLTIRQRFCDIVNSIWGLGIYVEPSETVVNLDVDANGVIADESEDLGTDEDFTNNSEVGDDDM